MLNVFGDLSFRMSSTVFSHIISIKNIACINNYKVFDFYELMTHFLLAITYACYSNVLKSTRTDIFQHNSTYYIYLYKI